MFKTGRNLIGRLGGKRQHPSDNRVHPHLDPLQQVGGPRPLQGRPQQCLAGSVLVRGGGAVPQEVGERVLGPFEGQEADAQGGTGGGGGGLAGGDAAAGVVAGGGELCGFVCVCVYVK